MAYIQKNNPFTVTSCGRRRAGGIGNGFEKTAEDSPLNLKRKRKRKKSNEPRKTTKGKGRNFRTVKEGAGMTAAGVRKYRAKNPGSKLKTAVTTKPSKLKPGSKDAKRRDAFCARSRSWKSERGLAARRRWNC
tara:strand:+ start:65 stop:463 length:399 start_codon:yes stop_codon:yes gene_type:complete